MTDPLRALRDYVFASLTIPPLDRRRICEAIDALRAALATDTAPLDGRAVHAAWRDGMLAQGRTVAPERMAWETLSQQDRDLDGGIAARLAKERDQG